DSGSERLVVNASEDFAFLDFAVEVDLQLVDLPRQLRTDTDGNKRPHGSRRGHQPSDLAARDVTRLVDDIAPAFAGWHDAHHPCRAEPDGGERQAKGEEVLETACHEGTPELAI